MRKTLKKIIAVILVLTALFSAAPAAQARTLNDFDEMKIQGVFVLDEFRNCVIEKPKSFPRAVSYSGYCCDGSVDINYKNGDIVIKTYSRGAAIVAIECYDKNGNCIGTEFDVVVVVDDADKARKGVLEKAYDIDVTINYKDEVGFSPDVKMTAEDGFAYLVLPQATGDSTYFYGNDTIYGYKRGTDSTHAAVVDTDGNLQVINFNVTVKYTFVQWLITIFLLGFLWY